MKIQTHLQQAVRISLLKIRWSHQNFFKPTSNRFWILLNDLTCLLDLKAQSNTWPIENRIKFLCVTFNHYPCLLTPHQVMKNILWTSNTIIHKMLIAQKHSFHESLQVRVSLILLKNLLQQTKMSRFQTQSSPTFKTLKSMLENQYAFQCTIKNQSWHKDRRICKIPMIWKTVLPWSTSNWRLKATLNQFN